MRRAVVAEGVMQEAACHGGWEAAPLLTLHRAAAACFGPFCVEVAVLVVVCWALRRRALRPVREEPLTEEEVDAKCAAMRPDPLVSGGDACRRERCISRRVGTTVTLDGKQAVDFASFNFLDMLGKEAVVAGTEAAIVKYGVGSCGPRGFYGTADVHLELEAALADFMHTEAAIIYSYDAVVASSILAAFMRAGDLVLCDEACCYGVLSGLRASRAHVKFFGHNDMCDLAQLLAIVEAADSWRPWRRLQRRFIVVEGLYQQTGLLAPLREVLALAERFRYRVFVEESMSFGVLGATGRGACEHAGVPTTAPTLICASMSTALSSIGGFAVSKADIAARQRLSSTGYCFSASLPQMHAVAAHEALRILRHAPECVLELRDNAGRMHDELLALCARLDEAAPDALVLLGDRLSPVQHLFLAWGTGERAGDIALLQRICDDVLEAAAFALVVPDYPPMQTRAPRASIRVAVSAGHRAETISRMVCALECAALRVLSRAAGATAEAGVQS